MSRLKTEPPAIRSPGEFAAVAASIADDAASRHEAQSRRMRQAGAHALAATYDDLARQQREQAGHVLARLPAAAGAAGRPPGIDGLVDDEGTDTAAAELLDPYRIFAVAARNAERAFAFWSYVAAHAPSADIGRAAEHLAGEELARTAWLRQRRRAAYHALRRQGDRRPAGLEALENRLAALLEERHEPGVFAGQARARASQLARAPFDPSLLSQRRPPSLPDAAWNGARPLCEALLDRYLELAGEARDEAARSRAQTFAAELIACLRFLQGA